MKAPHHPKPSVSGVGSAPSKRPRVSSVSTTTTPGLCGDDVDFRLGVGQPVTKIYNSCWKAAPGRAGKALHG
jgi:hypothetical protein